MNHQHRNGDRLTKQIIICTLCFVDNMITGALIWAVASGKPESITALREIWATLNVGLLALLGKTSTDTEKNEPQAVKTEPGQPLQTVEAKPPNNAPQNQEQGE